MTTAAGEVTERLGPADLGPAFREAFPDERFIVVSNREPYEHSWDDDDEIAVRRPAGGLTSALDPLMQAVGGTWIAWGSGDADHEVVDERDRVRVPAEDPAYTVRRLWLDERDINQYYFGYANQFLWPLCHLRPALTRLRSRYWDRYRAVNTRFAETVLEEAAGGPAAVWFHDYHLALAPRHVRRERPDLKLAHFWHIPFPPLEIFRVATNGATLLRGLLANDILGFHLPLFCDNFLRCVESVCRIPVDWDRRSVDCDGTTCYVRALPISIDVKSFEDAADGVNAEDRVGRVRARYAPGGGKIGIGVDRIDYSKGLEEKLTALDMLWERHPELREAFTYVQVAVSSRSGIDTYDWLQEKVERMVWSINDRHGTPEWRPVHLIRKPVSAERLAIMYRASDVCIVSSLQDGMNLVAKEYVASQVADPGGVLVLSRFAGAAEELVGSVEVNPFDPEEFASRIRDALSFSAEERRARNENLRASLRTIYDWMAETFQVWGASTHGAPAPFSDADRWHRFR